MTTAPAASTVLMTTKEVAALFRVDPHTVRKWVREGKLKARRNPGGQEYRFRAADVYALLADLDADAEPQNENEPVGVAEAGF